MSQQRFLRLPKQTKRFTGLGVSRASSAQLFQGKPPSSILQLQRTLGNRRVARLIRAGRLTPQGNIIARQRKLIVGAADDQYEQEADRAARQVMTMPDGASANSTQRAALPEGIPEEKTAEEDRNKILQTQPLTASITPLAQRQMEEEESEDKEMPLQAKSSEMDGASVLRQTIPEEEELEAIQASSAGSLADSFEAGDDVESRLNQSKGGGSPLPDSVRAYMEPRFGMDFNHVRVHTGSDAIQMNRDVGAKAFTHGADIYYGNGRSPANLELTAHELTHILQQTGGGPTKRLNESVAPSPDSSKQRVGTMDKRKEMEPGPPSQIHRKSRRVKISKPIISTSREQAKRKAREIGELINTNKWKPENNEQLVHWLEFFEGNALQAFESELEDAIGEKITEFEGNAKKHTDIFATSTEASLIIPTSEARIVRDGFKVAYFALVYEESSESTSIEVYNDLSVSAGFSIEIPIKKIARFKFGAEAKGGRRAAEKTEEKKGSRTGRTISRSFTIQKLERDVTNYQYIKTYHAPAPIAKEVTRAWTGTNPEIQHGYQIVPDEGGKSWGPFWNVYSGYVPVEGSALSQVWEILTVEQRNIAEDLMFGGRGR